MKVIILLLCTVLFFALDSIPVASARCKPDEVEICSTVNPLKGCFCERCRSCPKGYGPSYQCGGKYLNGTIITCTPCKSGVTFSETNSISSCEPCRQCGGREILKRCSPQNNAICGNKCRKGYIMNTVVEECVPDPSFRTTTSPQINTAKLTAHLLSTTAIPKTTASTTRPTQDTKSYTTTLQAGKTLRPETHGITKNILSKQPSSSDDSDHYRDIKIIISIIGTALILAIMVPFIYKRCSDHKNPRNKDEEMALTDKDSISPRSSQEMVPWRNNLCLCNIPHDLRRDITTSISKTSTVVFGWRAIGEARQISLSPSDLQAIENAGEKKGTNEGEQLLIKLATSHPELTVTEFVNILEGIGRKDVVDIIKTYYNEKQLNNVVQIEESQV